MFLCVARLSLDIPAAGSLKAKRQVLRRVTDRVKAKFNVAVAEVDDDESVHWAGVAMAVVGNERRFVTEMMDKIVQFIDDMYVAPVASRETETLNFGEHLFGSSGEPDFSSLTIPREERSLAEAEGLGDWERRHEKQPPPPGPSAPTTAAKKKAALAAAKLSLEEARAAARSLRNRREWEKKG